MTAAISLSTSWAKIADAGSVLVSFDTDGDVLVAFSSSAPSGSNYHTFESGARITGVAGADIYARLGDSEDTGTAKVDEFPDPVGVGSGLTLINVASNIGVSF